MSKKNIKKLFFLLLLNGTILTASLLYNRLFEMGDLGKCQFFETFGLYCPGCGGSRSLHALLNFNLLKSFIYYPPILITSFIILYIDARLIHSIFTEKEYKIRGKILLLVALSILISFILRYILLLFGIDPLGNILFNFTAIM